MVFLNYNTHKCHLALSYRTHAVLLRGIKIDAVAFVQNHDLIADGDLELTSQDKVKLLSCVRVLVVVCIARQRVDGHKERIHLTSLKPACKTLILIVFASSIWLNESNCAHAINGMSTKSVRDIKCLYIKLGLFTQQSQATFCHLEDDGAEQNECAYGMA